MIKEYKAHPLMLLRFIKPFLFVLVIPVIKGIIQYIVEQKITGVLKLEIMAFSAIMLVAYLQLRFFKLKLDEKNITLSKGFLLRRTATIDINKLSSVVSIVSPIDMICGSVTFRLNTEAGRKGKPDFEFKLYRKDAIEVKKRLYGEEKRAAVSYSLYRLALAAALSSSAFTGLIVAVPIINRIGDLIGIALSDMLIDEINRTAQSLNTYLPTIFNIIMIILIIGYLISFIYTLLRTLNYKLFSGDKHIELRYGLLIRRKTLFKRKSVNDICIEQTPFMRILNRYSMRVAVGGFGDEKGEKATIVPICKHFELKHHLSLGFNFFETEGNVLRAARTRKMYWRFMRIPLNYAVSVLIAGIIAILIFPYFDRLIVFIMGVLLIVIAYFASLRSYNYHFGHIQFGDNISARGSYGVKTRELYCPKEKVGVIKITQHIYDYKPKTCRVKVIIRSESADSVRVRHLNIDSVLENIKNCY